MQELPPRVTCFGRNLSIGHSWKFQCYSSLFQIYTNGQSLADYLTDNDLLTFSKNWPEKISQIIQKPVQRSSDMPRLWPSTACLPPTVARHNSGHEILIPFVPSDIIYINLSRLYGVSTILEINLFCYNFCQCRTVGNDNLLLIYFFYIATLLKNLPWIIYIHLIQTIFFTNSYFCWSD